MRDEAAGGLEVIDGACKYGHYHRGTPRFYPHYSLSTGATLSPNFLHFNCAHNVNVANINKIHVLLLHPESRCFEAFEEDVNAKKKVFTVI